MRPAHVMRKVEQDVVIIQGYMPISVDRREFELARYAAAEHCADVLSRSDVAFWVRG